MNYFEGGKKFPESKGLSEAHDKHFIANNTIKGLENKRDRILETLGGEDIHVQNTLNYFNTLILTLSENKDFITGDISMMVDNDSSDNIEFLKRFDNKTEILASSKNNYYANNRQYGPVHQNKEAS